MRNCLCSSCERSSLDIGFGEELDSTRTRSTGELAILTNGKGEPTAVAMPAPWVNETGEVIGALAEAEALADGEGVGDSAAVAAVALDLLTRASICIFPSQRQTRSADSSFASTKK